MAIAFPSHIPFIEQLGCELQRFEGGQAEVSLLLRDELHTNSFGVAHGGLLMTLLDLAMAMAARSLNQHLADGGPGLVTIEMKTTFMRPGLGRLRAVGQRLHGTASMAFCEGRVLNDADELCAHATATFKYLRALPVGRQAKALHLAAPASVFQGSGSD